MVDRIEKALRRLSQKERKQIKSIFEQISSGDLRGLDVKKLKGREDIFRVRKGDIRIMYRVSSGRVFVLAIERRSEKTYRDL